MKPNYRHLLLAAAALCATISHWANAQSSDLLAGTARSAQSVNVTSGARAAAPKTGNESLNRIIIKFKSSDAAHAVSTQFSADGQARIQAMGMGGKARPRMADGSQGNPVGLSYLKTIHNNTHVAVTSTPMNHAELASVAAALAQDPDVEYAEVDEIMHHQMTPNDNAFASSLWNMMAPGTVVGGANFVKAWDLTLSGTSTPVNGAGVVIAVLDTGYSPHGDLDSNILPNSGYDFVSAAMDRDITSGWDSDAQDPGDWSSASDTCGAAPSSWHGTHVAGIAAAVGNNNIGVIGGAYGAQILPVRVLGVCGGFTSDIAEGMYWAAGLHQIHNNTIAKVINLSLGGSAGDLCDSTYQNAVNAVTNAGTVVVAATGNDYNNSTIAPPANCANVIAVTAHMSSGESPTYANIGNGTTISAPGSDIYSTMNSGTTTPGGDTYATYSGTSMATPHVAAAAALLLQVNPSLQPGDIKNYLTSTARAFPAGSYCDGRTTCGAGLLDAYAAVKKLQLAMSSGTNHAPVLSPIAAQTGSTAGALQFTASATDADNDTVSFTISGLPSGASFNNGSGVFSWNHPVAGSYNVTITPTDGITSGSAQAVSISVTQAPGSGGGGGAIGWGELMGLLFLAGSAWGLRRTKRLPRRAQ